jgi:malonyl-CoA decarboxylase
VAHFHLGNGAQLHAVHAGADPSDTGQGNSWGVMVNYLYDLGKIEANHQAYANEGEIAAAPKVRQLARM